MPPDWQARPLQKTQTVPTWCARLATSVTLVHAVHNGNIIAPNCCMAHMGIAVVYNPHIKLLHCRLRFFYVHFH